MGLDNDDIKQLIAILQRGLIDDNKDQETVDEVPRKKPSKQNQTKIKTNKKAAPKRENRFMNMPEMHMHKDDTLFDKRVIVAPPTPRRSAFQPVSVRCRVCGKTDMVDPSIIEAHDRYKCNKCASSAG